uniref:Ig-like domain-containing protein n=1 Tax=Aotus nancymaae TaxID=37293 RepID=A0A2K5EGE7_AOTNA
GPARSPDVFRITSECELPRDDNSVVLACLITGYNPKPVNVTWYLGTQIQLQRNFPEVQGKENSYTTSSQLFTPVSRQHQSEYKCVVRHVPSNNSTEKTFRRPGRKAPRTPTPSTQAEGSPSKGSRTPAATRNTGRGGEKEEEEEQEGQTKPLLFSAAPSKHPALEASKAHICSGESGQQPAHAQWAFAHRSDLLPRLPAAAQAPVKLSLNLLASSAPPEVASWLLCKVSGFSPPDVLLTWLQDQHEVNASWFATAHPAPQPGSTTFQAWSVLRVPAPPSPQPANYTCKVHHKASQTLLNASLSLDVSYLTDRGPVT